MDQNSSNRLSTNHLINEQAIISACKRDPRHFQVLYESYYNPILNYIHSKVNDIDEAADIASNVFYKAMLNIHKYKHLQVPFSAWLYKIAFNETMMFFRKAKKMQMVVIDEELVENIREDIPSDSKELLFNAIINVMDELNREEVEILEQRYFLQKTNKEIAFILGKTEGNLKVKVHRIIQKIKKLIAERNEKI